MDVFTGLLTIALVCFCIYIWNTMTFFKNTGIPHDSPWPIVGNMAPVVFKRSQFIEHCVNSYNRWPDAKYWGFYDCITPVIVIRDLELIKSIGMKNFDNFMDHRNFVNEDSDPMFGKSLFGLKGDRWREVRSLLSPAFTSSKMRQMFELVSDCSKDFTDFLVENAKKGVTDLEMKSAFNKFTNDVIASTAFGITVNTMKDPNNEFYKFSTQAINLQGWKAIKMLFTRFCPKLAKWLNVKVFDEKVTKFFMDIVKTTIEIRDQKGISRPDMIQLMMDSRDNKDTVQLDLVEMTAQAFIFFFGGFDTSSGLMSFTAMALALNPEVQERLLAEVDEVLERTNGKPNYDDVNNMAYLEATLYETLRYYPIAGFLDRLCTKSFELPPALPGGKPFLVKPGMNLWVPVQSIHEDPEYYENPKKFDPERFLENTKMLTNSATYLPFGIGPRFCIGNRFALLENKLLLFHLLSKCKLVPSAKLKLPISYSKSSFTAMVEGGWWLKIIPRD